MTGVAKKVLVIGVPLDLGAEKLGVEMGPSAIRHAGLARALKVNGIEFDDVGDLAVDRGGDPVSVIGAVAEEVAELTASAVASGVVPVILGGDHSAAIGSIAGAAKESERLGVIWLDYHPDSNTPETSPSGNVHGMTVAISLGYGHAELVNCAGFTPKVRPEDFYMVGAKDIDEGERAFIETQGVPMFTMFDVERLGITQIVDTVLDELASRCDRIHVSFDVDVLDSLVAPGTGIQSRGGLSYREISYVMESLGRLGVVGSLDVIEINPLLDVRNQTSELAIELLLSCLGGSYGDYERNYLHPGGGEFEPRKTRKARKGR
jgi:arginase